MPTIKNSSGKVRKYPYTKQGVAAAEIAAKQPGVTIKVDKKIQSVTKPSSSPAVKVEGKGMKAATRKRFGISNLKKGYQ